MSKEKTSKKKIRRPKKLSQEVQDDVEQDGDNGDKELQNVNKNNRKRRKSSNWFFLKNYFN